MLFTTTAVERLILVIADFDVQKLNLSYPLTNFLVIGLVCYTSHRPL